jgi:hypothetical protein
MDTFSDKASTQNEAGIFSSGSASTLTFRALKGQFVYCHFVY